MKVATFVSYLPPHTGGIEVVADEQTRALAVAGNNVQVITSACGSSAGMYADGHYTARRIRAWNYFEQRMGAVFPLFTPSLWWYAYQAVKEADVVHAHDAFYLTSWAAAFWAWMLGRPLVVTQHVGIVPHPRKAVMGAQRAVYATTGRFVLRSARRVVVINPLVRNFLLEQDIKEHHIEFLPHGVDTGKFTPASDTERLALRRKYGLPADKLLALFVGRFVPKKGFDTLLALESIDGLELVFAGGSRPAGHNRRDHNFLGAVSREAMPDVCRMCDIFVMPSQNECFPIATREAMAAGLAVITTDDSAYAHYQLDRRHIALIQPTKTNISGSLIRLLRDRDKLKAAKQYSRKFACEHFNQETQLAKLLQVYNAVLVEGSARRDRHPYRLCL